MVNRPTTHAISLVAGRTLTLEQSPDWDAGGSSSPSDLTALYSICFSGGTTIWTPNQKERCYAFAHAAEPDILVLDHEDGIRRAMSHQLDPASRAKVMVVASMAQEAHVREALEAEVGCSAEEIVTAARLWPWAAGTCAAPQPFGWPTAWRSPSSPCERARCLP
jgi:hypothetical protein